MNDMASLIAIGHKRKNKLDIGVSHLIAGRRRRPSSWPKCVYFRSIRIFTGKCAQKRL